jgi:hypothetical protein
MSSNEPDLRSWRERHALTFLGVMMVTMFALVIIVQVAC